MKQLDSYVAMESKKLPADILEELAKQEKTPPNGKAKSA
jgi:hypothetical protein